MHITPWRTTKIITQRDIAMFQTRGRGTDSFQGSCRPTAVDNDNGGIPHNFFIPWILVFVLTLCFLYPVLPSLQLKTLQPGAIVGFDSVGSGLQCGCNVFFGGREMGN